MHLHIHLSILIWVPSLETSAWNLCAREHLFHFCARQKSQTRQKRLSPVRVLLIRFSEVRIPLLFTVVPRDVVLSVAKDTQVRKTFRRRVARRRGKQRGKANRKRRKANRKRTANRGQ